MKTLPLEARSVSHAYDGHPVLQDFNLQVRPGSIYGFLGRNGAGKSTAIRMLAGLIRPAQGEVRVQGSDPFTLTAEQRQQVGYLSERQILPSSLSVDGVLRFCAPLYPAWNRPLVETLLRRFSIQPRQRIANLSQGAARMLGFILAIAPQPDVLLLDEPAANLDVVARREFLDQILELIREGGKTVFFSTHVLGDIERVADEVGILAHGRLQISESLDTLKDSVKKARFHRFPNGHESLRPPGALRVEHAGNEIHATLKTRDPEEIRRWADAHRCEVEWSDLNLEDIFVEIAQAPKGTLPQ
jgi:ABC-2 type transport system ATP-binding protein